MEQKEETTLEWPYVAAFGLLAAAVGITAGGAMLPMILLSIALMGAYLLAERRQWLLRVTDKQWARDCIVTAVFSVLVVIFVALTGRSGSPLDCALYLPVLLGTLCFGMRIGLATSLGMAAACGAFALGDAGVPGVIPWRVVGVGLSFPLTALFASVLRAQMETRIRTLHSETRNLSALLDMSQMMDTAFDLDMTLNLILLNVQQLTDCQACAVYLTGSDGQMLELRAASGPRDRIKLKPALRVDEMHSEGWSLLGMVGPDSQVKAFYAPEHPGPSARAKLFEIDPHVQSFACLPLTSIEGLLGMLYVGYQQEQGMTPEGVHRLEQLATRAAFPLQRFLHEQDFRSLAYSDAMTGLDNFRQFEQTLAEEMLRAERYSRPLSLILLDIDHFKQFNDTLGHPAGDALLAQLAVVLRNTLRNVDRPARYGGEEFVVICPETDLEGARLIAERLRRSVSETPFALLEPSGETSHVTVSVGFATFPCDAHNARDLVKKADAALYDAKEAGRNVVRGYDESRSRVLVA